MKIVDLNNRAINACFQMTHREHLISTSSIMSQRAVCENVVVFLDNEEVATFNTIPEAINFVDSSITQEVINLSKEVVDLLVEKGLDTGAVMHRMLEKNSFIQLMKAVYGLEKDLKKLSDDFILKSIAGGLNTGAAMHKKMEYTLQDCIEDLFVEI